MVCKNEYKKGAKVTSTAACTSVVRSKSVDEKIDSYSLDIDDYPLILSSFFKKTNNIYYYNLNKKNIIIPKNCNYLIYFNPSQVDRNFSLFSNENDYDKVKIQYSIDNKNPILNDNIKFIVRIVNSNNFSIKNILLKIKEIFDLNFVGELISLTLDDQYVECGNEPNVKKYPYGWVCCPELNEGRQKLSQCEESISIGFDLLPNSYQKISLIFKVINPPSLPFITGEPEFFAESVVEGQVISTQKYFNENLINLSNTKKKKKGIIVGSKKDLIECDKVKFTPYEFKPTCCSLNSDCEPNELCCSGYCQECCSNDDCQKHCLWIMEKITNNSVESIEGCEYQNNIGEWLCKKIVENNNDESCINNIELLEYRDLVVSTVGYDNGYFSNIGGCCNGKCKTSDDSCLLNENCDCISSKELNKINVTSGSDVYVNFDTVSLNFSNVTKSGEVLKTNIFSSQDLGYYFYNISTTAEFDGDSFIGITVPEDMDFNNVKIYQLINEENLQIFDVNSSNFNDITITDGANAPDPDNRRVYAPFDNSSSGTFVLTPDGGIGAADNIWNTTVSGQSSTIVTLNPDGTVASINRPTLPPCPGAQVRSYNLLEGYGECGCYTINIDIENVEQIIDAILIAYGLLKVLTKRAIKLGLDKIAKGIAKDKYKSEYDDALELLDEAEKEFARLTKSKEYFMAIEGMNRWTSILEKLPPLSFLGKLLEEGGMLTDEAFIELMDLIGYDDAVWIRDNIHRFQQHLPDDVIWTAAKLGPLLTRIKYLDEELIPEWGYKMLISEERYKWAADAFKSVCEEFAALTISIGGTIAAINALLENFYSIPALIAIPKTCSEPYPTLDELTCLCQGCAPAVCEWVFDPNAENAWRLGDPDGIGSQAVCQASGCSCPEPGYTPFGFTVDYTGCME